MNLIFALILFVFSNNSTNNLNCNQLPTQFSSYEQAKNLVKTATYKYTESIKTPQSSWIIGASYYSCDGIKGYFILKTNGKEYIFQDLPKDKWLKFKNANSHGEYYNQNIKGRYNLKLN
jgi:hypothetical protein